ncbi:MAG TPA: hypothetical protein VII00_05805 [bacterium]
MRLKITQILMLLVFITSFGQVFAYPPAVGILGKAKNCLACHVSNGAWKDDGKIIIDILDKETKKLFRQSDGSFIVEVKRGEIKTVLTVIGRIKDDTLEAPYRNAWLYVNPSSIEINSLSKFAPGWDVNLPMACRIVGDKLEEYEGAKITILPMSIRPTDSARDSELILQVMLTKGDSIKGNPKKGMIGNYFERKVKLKVID